MNERGRFLDRLPAGPKLAGLAGLGTLVFFLSDPLSLAIVVALALAGYRLAGLGRREILADLRPILVTALLLAAVEIAADDGRAALLTVLRMTAMLCLGALFTRTTRTGELIEAIERRLAFSRAVGLDPRPLALAIALTLRFVPVLADIAGEIRAAQAARNAGFSLRAFVLPLLARTLKMAETISEAIEARSFESRNNRQG